MSNCILFIACITIKQQIKTIKSKNDTIVIIQIKTKTTKPNGRQIKGKHTLLHSHSKRKRQKQNKNRYSDEQRRTKSIYRNDINTANIGAWATERNRKRRDTRSHIYSAQSSKATQ